MELCSACAGPSRNSFQHLFQKHNILARPPKTEQTSPQTQATQGPDEREWSLYHVVLLGRSDWQEDLGTGAWRELDRLRRGLQGRDWLRTSTEGGVWKEEKRTKERRRGEREGKGRNNTVNHTRYFI